MSHQWPAPSITKYTQVPVRAFRHLRPVAPTLLGGALLPAQASGQAERDVRQRRPCLQGRHTAEHGPAGLHGAARRLPAQVSSAVPCSRKYGRGQLPSEAGHGPTSHTHVKGPTCIGRKAKRETRQRAGGGTATPTSMTEHSRIFVGLSQKAKSDNTCSRFLTNSCC